ncbi:MAG TPA: low molecular weight protein-tyrosine-phosphatase [Flavobacteriaceae bacterium]|nr:low molecular weight protein-tyrosine-phosphatase [Flavobacteriaceae bacterium]
MKTKIVMVCLGNICRSPLAEGILKSKLKTENVVVDSAGTGDWHAGETPDPRSIETAKKNGIDITGQRARQFKVSDFDAFDIIYVMDASNEENVKKLARNETDKKKVKRILSELPNVKYTDVPDPYFGGITGFDDVYEMLDQACEVIAKRFIK